MSAGSRTAGYPRPSGRIVVALSSVVLGASLAVAPSAPAAFPGVNGKIAFNTDRNGNGEIYVMNADGTGQTNLSNNPAGDYANSWSPDGSKLAFTTYRDGNAEVYVMNADGTSPVNLTNNPASDGPAAWSADGQKLAFVSDRDSVNGEIYVMNADGTGVVRLTNNSASDNEPVWSPDGTKIAFSTHRDGNWEVYVMNADGTGQTNCTNSSATDLQADWSPDGSKIAFTRNGQVHVINADCTGAATNVSNADGGEPVWSPDGTKIAFTTSRDGNFEVYVMNADGTGQTNLSNYPAAQDAPAAWQPIVGPGPPATLTLAPPSATNKAGEQHCVTATVKDASGTPTPNVTVRFSVTGANSASGSQTTNSNGEAQFCYTGTTAGGDTIRAFADSDGDTAQDAGEPGDTASKTYTAANPATLKLVPATSSNTVGSQHCVTARLKDAFANPTPNITVRFTVTGSVTTSGSATTDANGEAEFCYQGPELPGGDVISAFADTDNDNTQDTGEPFDTATKAWVVPASTAGCKVTNGGHITANSGDKASFGGNAKVPLVGTPTGDEEYRDHGPAQPLTVKSTQILAVICDISRSQATIFGRATIDGSGSHLFKIDVQDPGEPGAGRDTYRILMDTGYDSGVHKLNGGNVQIR